MGQFQKHLCRMESGGSSLPRAISTGAPWLFPRILRSTHAMPDARLLSQSSANRDILRPVGSPDDIPGSAPRRCRDTGLTIPGQLATSKRCEHMIDVPRVKRERMATVGDCRRRLSGSRPLYRPRFRLESPGVLTKTHHPSLPGGIAYRKHRRTRTTPTSAKSRRYCFGAVRHRPMSWRRGLPLAVAALA
jgi:hypothetical protein